MKLKVFANASIVNQVKDNELSLLDLKNNNSETQIEVVDPSKKEDIVSQETTILQAHLTKMTQSCQVEL